MSRDNAGLSRLTDGGQGVQGHRGSGSLGQTQGWLARDLSAIKAGSGGGGHLPCQQPLRPAGVG